MYQEKLMPSLNNADDEFYLRRLKNSPYKIKVLYALYMQF